MVEAARLQGGWDLPGWVEVPATIGGTCRPEDVRPWPRHVDASPSTDPPTDLGQLETHLKAPLRILAISLSRVPVALTAPATSLVIGTCGTTPWSIGDPSCNPDTQFTQSISSSSPTSGGEHGCWLWLNKVIGKMDPDVVILPHMEYYVGP